MPSNQIVDRVAEFLRTHPPFMNVEKKWLNEIASSVEVIYFEDRKKIFNENDPPGNYCYVIRKGKVDLLQIQAAENVLIDVCGEGDIFGVRSMLSGENYKMTAIVDEEALIYALPVKLMREAVRENVTISQFFAFGLASGKAVLGHQGSPGESLLSGFRQWKPYDQPEPVPVIPSKRTLISCKEGDTIRKAAGLMAHHQVGSILIVNERDFPVGIITDTDLRNKVATGRKTIDRPVESIMSNPVITIKPDLNVYEVVLKMMDTGVHHLCITEDGTDNTRATGIISNHDLLVSQGAHPALLIRSIDKCQDLDGLKALFSEAEKLGKHYLTKDEPLGFINNVITGIRTHIIRQAVLLVKNRLVEDTLGSFSWLSLGSDGREEQLLKTDVDNILCYEESLKRGKQPFLELAQRINNFLFEAGYKPCPAGTMAHLPENCRSIKEWKEIFSNWIKSPEQNALMNATIYFDLRIVAGSHTPGTELKDFLRKTIDENDSFLNFLALNATQNPPPLSFFNQFIVESSGEHKDEFDLKKRALMPLSDAARVLAFYHRFFESSNTMERFRFIAGEESVNRNLFEEARIGYQYLLRTRAVSGFHNHNEGRYIHIPEFNKYDKKLLKEIFQVISEIQRILRVRFQLDYFPG